MDNLALMSFRADTLFTYDARGRMLHTNEPDAHPVPLVFLGRTSSGYVMRFGQGIADTRVQAATRLVERRPQEGDLQIPSKLCEQVRLIVQQDAPITEEEGGPAYRFPEAIAAPGDAIQLTEANLELASHTYPWLLTELAEWRPCFAVVRDGAAVSICFSSRIGAEVCEAGVNTLPEYRGRGYAAAVTAAWAVAIRDSGRIPLYSTSWQNAASQGLARHLGLIMFGTDMSWS